jgi:hypothetical protein
VRIRSEIGFVSKHVERPHAIPRLGESVKALLKRRREPAVSGVTVGNKRVVEIARRWLREQSDPLEQRPQSPATAWQIAVASLRVRALSGPGLQRRHVSVDLALLW